MTAALSKRVLQHVHAREDAELFKVRRLRQGGFCLRRPYCVLYSPPCCVLFWQSPLGPPAIDRGKRLFLTLRSRPSRQSVRLLAMALPKPLDGEASAFDTVSAYIKGSDGAELSARHRQIEAALAQAA